MLTQLSNSSVETKTILLAKTKPIQLRAGGLKNGAISEYAKKMKQKYPIDPIDVVYEQETDTYWVWDGSHRVAAALKVAEALKTEAGIITANVRVGVRQDAEWLACSANSKHGIQRTNADKRQAVSAALAHPNAKGKSSRVIAEHCGVTHTFVNLMKRKQTPSISAQPETVSAQRKQTPSISASETEPRNGKAEAKPTPLVVKDRPRADKRGPTKEEVWDMFEELFVNEEAPQFEFSVKQFGQRWRWKLFTAWLRQVRDLVEGS